MPSIDVQPFAQVTGLNGVAEVHDITADGAEVEADLLVPVAHQCRRPQDLSQHVERLAQSGACARLVELRPKEGKQAVAPMSPTRGGGCEVGEEGEASRLGDETAGITPRARAKAQSSEHPELDHVNPPRQRGRSSEATSDRHRARDGFTTGA